MSIAVDLAEPPRPPAVARPLLDEGRSLLRLAAPIMLICLVNMGMSVTDTAMVSRSSAPRRSQRSPSAATSIRSSSISAPASSPASHRSTRPPWSRADPAERARLERSGRLAVALLAVLLVPLVWTAPDWLARLGLEPDLLAQGQGYTRAMAVTLVPMLGVALYRTILTAAEKPRLFLRVTLAMLPLNAAAELCPDDRRGTPPRLRSGRLRPRIAARRDDEPRNPRRGRPARRRTSSAPPASTGKALPRSCVSACPIGIATVAEVGVFLAATIYAATLGAADVAAHTLALRAAGIAYAVPTALLQAAMVRGARAEASARALRQNVRRAPLPSTDRPARCSSCPCGRRAAARRSLL